MSELTTSVEPPGSGPAHGDAARSRLGIAGHPPGLIDEEPRDPLIEVAIPVYNEEHVLAASVRRLHAYLRETFPYRFVITIADNASTDGTWDVAQRLALEIPAVDAVHLDRKGRGRALRHVWSTSVADVVAYMDVDLSTDLHAFLPLIAPLVSGHSDLAIGTRLSRGSAVVRGPKREFISRTYNLLLRTTLAARFSDAQCGFKAGRTEIVRALLPAVEDEAWFFDTELLLLAERNGLRIHEVPVDWVDDPDSRVDVARTAVDDLRGMARVARRVLSGAFHVPVPARTREAQLPTGMSRQLPSFAVIGVISTIAQLALYALLRFFMPVIAANVVSYFIAAIANTAANRRFTFGVRGRRRAMRHHLEGGVAFIVGLVVSTAGLAVFDTVAPYAPRLAEVAALFALNLFAAVIRFVLLRAWVFHPRRAADESEPVLQEQSR
ncbi:bifunctional glycosyltransferase family 2/GtrA family protein [Actinoallomurus purpureus]|uniref:bifunctional glycosyltransferase family 2/GtrA family protein n=1 Tax=Actinoallomurus purpureus TaxID=478114 RepID=UPI0020930630|nr:bifunctional glycosyltransferase family 2/GtrA family protein [Actinoallomurus purpureus]MCO6006368.1 bifunctional glycosyltransferase family 2/GtrA family protein [Actinoallomurus purpureus]